MVRKRPNDSGIQELEQMFRAKDPRGKPFPWSRRRLLRALYILNLIFIIGVAIYLLAVYGARFLEAHTL